MKSASSFTIDADDGHQEREILRRVAQESGDPLFCDPLTIEKLEAAIEKMMAQRSDEPIDLTPRFIAISPARAREVARDHGIEIVWRRR